MVVVVVVVVVVLVVPFRFGVGEVGPVYLNGFWSQILTIKGGSEATISKLDLGPVQSVCYVHRVPTRPYRPTVGTYYPTW